MVLVVLLGVADGWALDLFCFSWAVRVWIGMWDLLMPKGRTFVGIWVPVNIVNLGQYIVSEYCNIEFIKIRFILY